MRLYEIAVEISEILDLAYEEAENNNGEIPDNLSNRIDGLEIERDRILDYFSSEYVSLIAESDAYKEEKDKLDRWKKSVDNRANWIKSYIESVIDEGEKWSNSRHKISWRGSERVVLNGDINDIDDEFKKTTAELRKSDVKKAIKAGYSVGNCEIVKTKNIQIK